MAIRKKKKTTPKLMPYVSGGGALPNSTTSSGSGVTVQDIDTVPSQPDNTVLQFDQASGLLITYPTGTTARIAIDQIPQANIVGLVSALAAINGDIVTIEGNIVTINGQIVTIQGDIITLTTAVNNRVPLTRLISTTSPITGGGDLSADRTIAINQALLDLFTSVARGVVPPSGGGTTNFLRADGNWAAPPSGSGGSANVGKTTVNFGAFPGTTDASVAVTGQASILAGSVVQAWLLPQATADHSADEHLFEPIKVFAGNIVAGTGFTIYAISDNRPQPDPAYYPPLFNNVAAARDLKGNQSGLTTPPKPDLPMIYGLWSVAWMWA